MYGQDQDRNGFGDIIDTRTLEQGSVGDMYDFANHDAEIGSLIASGQIRHVASADDIDGIPGDGQLFHAEVGDVTQGEALVRLGDGVYALNPSEQGAIAAVSRAARANQRPRPNVPKPPISNFAALIRQFPVLAADSVRPRLIAVENGSIVSADLEPGDAVTGAAVRRHLMDVVSLTTGNGQGLFQAKSVAATDATPQVFNLAAPFISGVVGVDLSASQLEAVPGRFVTLRLEVIKFTNGVDAAGGTTPFIDTRLTVALGEQRTATRIRLIPFRRLGNAFFPTPAQGAGAGGIQNSRVTVEGAAGLTIRTTWGSVTDPVTRGLAGAVGLGAEFSPSLRSAR